MEQANNFTTLFKANLSSTDLELFKKLGLTEFKQLEAQTDFDCGYHHSETGSVHVIVTSMPAKFWKFIIHREDSPTAQVLETGSGDMYQYWPFVEQVLSGILEMKTIPAAPFIAGWHKLSPGDEMLPELVSSEFIDNGSEEVLVCNATGLVIARTGELCSTMYFGQTKSGTFDECIQWLTEKTGTQEVDFISILNQIREIERTSKYVHEDVLNLILPIIKHHNERGVL